MPTPGFPDWLGPGAIVRERPDAARPYVSDHRFVITDVELKLPEPPATEGTYNIALMTVQERSDPRSLTLMLDVDRASLHVVNLSALLDLYEWTSEYLMPDGTLAGVGTTLPVVMAATALRPTENFVIQGSGAFDGEYLIQSVAHHTGVRIGIDIELRTRASIFETPGTMPDADAEIEDIDMSEDPDFFTPEDRDLDVDAPVAPSESPPLVAANQVWLLPQPNEGLWRTSITSRVDMHVGRRAAITLTHTRERDRVMRCTSTWLMEHGVRQEPPDPRANRPGQQIVVGQLWEFNADAGPRYQRTPKWRVHAIDESTGQVCLMAADGSGKRIYLPTARIIAMATFAGDGLPRRTAFEHILDADDVD